MQQQFLLPHLALVLPSLAARPAKAFADAAVNEAMARAATELDATPGPASTL